MSMPLGRTLDAKWSKSDAIEGTYTYPDGKVYMGPWQFRERNGHGILKYPDGRVYEGEFKSGLRTGIGVMTWPNGRSYVGDFVKGERTGKGTMTYPDGRMYVGEFQNGERTGRGLLTLPNGERRGIDTQSYTTSEIRRVAARAFELARGRKRDSKFAGVLSCEKSNVMDSGLLWREEVTKLHAEQYSDVKLDHMLADAAAMHLVRAPKDINVLLADNLFGDILSDEASMLTGSIGMLPSASLGEPGTPGLYEPVHGSAPDIAGKGIANPIAAILSLEMVMRWSLGRAEVADRIFAAVDRALQDGARTADIGGSMSTRQMADAILKYL
jgi:isocitrate/isopropylmalate dehydrogenase